MVELAFWAAGTSAVFAAALVDTHHLHGCENPDLLVVSVQPGCHYALPHNITGYRSPERVESRLLT